MAAFKIGSFNLIPAFIVTTVWCVHGSTRLAAARRRAKRPRPLSSLSTARAPRLSSTLPPPRSIAGIGALPYGAKWLLNGEVRFCLRAALARGAGG